MARTKMVSYTEEYSAMLMTSLASGDNNDCFPKAIAVLTGLPFETVVAAFAEAGRVTGKGTPWGIAREAIKALGFKLERMGPAWWDDMLESYPGVHKNLKNITTRHPVRFAKQWEGVSVLMHVNAHVAAVKDGKMHDWSINRSKHVIDIYKVVKL